jgi:hypothetical protein
MRIADIQSVSGFNGLISDVAAALPGRNSAKIDLYQTPVTRLTPEIPEVEIGFTVANGGGLPWRRRLVCGATTTARSYAT